MLHAAQVWAKIETITKDVAARHPSYDLTAIIDTWGRVSIAFAPHAEVTATLGGLPSLEHQIRVDLTQATGEEFEPWLGATPVLDLTSNAMLKELVQRGRAQIKGGPPNAFLLSRSISNESWRATGTKTPEGWPPVVAFYSFKGGAGRSTAAALTALLMARESKRVLLVDLDLEAPGLEGFYGMKVPEDGAGMVDLLLEMSITGGRWSGDISEYRLRYAEDKIITSAGGRLDVAPAGLLDATYPERLGRLTLADMARQGGGAPNGPNTNTLHRAIDELTRDQGYDVVIVDCRTGFTDIGGMALNGLSTLDVLVFKASKSERQFVDVVVRNMARLRSAPMNNEEDARAAARSLLVVFSLAQPPATEQERSDYEEELRTVVSRVLGERVFQPAEAFWSYPAPMAQDTPFDPVPHDIIIIPYLSKFTELSLATDMTRTQDVLSDPPYTRLMRRIVDVKLADAKLAEPTVMPVVSAIVGLPMGSQEMLIEALKTVAPAPSGEEDLQNENDLTDRFLPRAAHRELLSSEVLIIQGPKGSGKSALAQVFKHKGYLQQLAAFVGVPERERAQLERTELVVAFPLVDQEIPTKKAVASLFESLENVPAERHHEALRGFWCGMLCLVLSQHAALGLPSAPDGLFGVQECADCAFDKKAQQAQIAWLSQAKQVLGGANPREVQVLYDTLDVGLTSAPKYRSALLSALVDLWRDLGGRNSPIKGRIFLRDDLWLREVGLTDKAKFQLGTHRIKLAWDAIELYRLVIKRLLVHESFRTLLKTAGLWRPELEAPPVAAPLLGLVPPADEVWVRRAIETLVGETMGGNRKRGFLYTWLINHTADGNGVTRPRSLLVLFTQAAILQGTLPKHGPPLGSNSLREALRSEVSLMAVEELRAEYRTDWSTADETWIPDKFADIQRTWPVESKTLRLGVESALEGSNVDVSDLILGMEEAGLLKPRETGEGEYLQIPDIYLYGLNLTRRG